MSFIKKRYFILFIFLLKILPAYSQEQSLIFQNLDSDDGLSQNSVYSIFKDRYGFMWFATQDGLNRYDGYKFSVFKHNENDKNSIAANDIFTLCEDNQSNIWIGTRIAGLSKFDRRTNKFQNFRNDSTKSNSLSNDRITALFNDRSQKIWIGTANGLNLFDRKTNSFIRFFSDPHDANSLSANYIKSIYEDKAGRLWVGTASGLNLFNKQTGKCIRYLNKPTDQTTISNNSITAILEDDLRQLWVGSENGLNLFDEKQKAFIRYKVNVDNNTTVGINPITSIAKGQKNQLWLGTNTHLQLFDTQHRKFIPIVEKDSKGKRMEGNGIRSLFEDPQGILWVGCLSLGINKFDRNLSFFPSLKTGQKTAEVAGNIIRGMAEDIKGDLYVGTDAGLQYINRKTNVITYYQHKVRDKTSLSSNYTSCVLASKQHDEVWVGTFESGVDCLDTKSGVFKHYTYGSDAYHLSDSIISALMEDKYGNIWLGMDKGGVNVFNRQTKTFTKYIHQKNNKNSLVDNIAEAFMQDKAGNIWIGSYDSGITVYNPSNKKFTRLNLANSQLSSNVVSCFYQDSKGIIWVGTMEGGFNKYDSKTKKFKAYTEQQGLINNVVYFITEDSKGYLWFSTNQGVVRFDPVKEAFKNFSTYNGLQSQEFNFGAGLKTAKGEIVLGGLKGINIFDPLKLSENKNIPPVQITNFELFNKPIYPGTKDSPLKQGLVLTKEINLNYQQTVITFEFAALDYTRPEKNNYAYILENFDKEWNFVGTQHKATYTNLDPGTYFFRVKASNNDGVWNEKGAMLKIIIKPPFWLTWWFKILVVSCVFGLIYSFYKYRINLIKAQKRKLENEVWIRTSELSYKSEELTAQSESLKVLNNELIVQQLLEKQARKDAEVAREEAENANLAKSTFLATMSHEIRTPMNGVLGMTSILEKTNLNHEQRQYTDIIKVSGENLLHVINDILDFSKIESGNMELDVFDFNLRNLIEEVMDLFVGKAVSSGIELLYEIDPEIPDLIEGDGNRLRQILINLIGNAAKFTHDGEIHLKVDLNSKDNTALDLCFQIRDTGIGISKDKLHRLFKSFSQVDSSTTRKYGGTGLGLVICKRLIDLMGGNIIVESEVGKGATFIFDIRCNSVTDYKNPFLIQKPENCQDKKVLVIDDNGSNLRILSTQLERWHMAAETAKTGYEALKILSEPCDFDLVIVDFHLPDTNGLELSKQIKKQYGDLPIILLIPVSEEVDERYTSLFSSIIFKPIKKRLLRDALNTEFSGNKALSRDVKQLNLLSINFAVDNPLKILIADDDLLNHQFMSVVLTKLGYRPKFVNNGNEALKALDEENYSIIFMGIQMPELDGMETTKIIRSNNKYQPIIVAITANAIGINKEAYLSAGIDEYITKPIDIAVLQRILEKAAGKWIIS